MKRSIITGTNLIRVNNSTEGETIEMKIERIMSNQEPISDGAPLIYTDRDEGVLPAYDIRTDRFDVAIEAMDKVTKMNIAKREEIKAEKAKAAAGEPAAGEPAGSEPAS